MIKYKHSTVIEVGDDCEFCVIVDGISNVLYGRITRIDKSLHIVDFERLKYGKKMVKVLTGEVFSDVKAIRGIGHIHPDTWKEENQDDR